MSDSNIDLAQKYWRWALAYEHHARDLRRHAASLHPAINGKLCAGVGAIAVDLVPVIGRSGEPTYMAHCPICNFLVQCDRSTEYRIAEHRRPTTNGT